MMELEGSDAMDEARDAAEHGGLTDRLIARLVERFGGRTGVQALFGEPVERGQSTIVPVGRMRWLVGAGSGSASIPGGDGSGDGSGAGGAAVADPVGYIEMGPSGVRFRPIVGLPPNPLAILAIGLSITLVLRGLARLIKR
jgi:uncharacterized spore protein YtfJ